MKKWLRAEWEKLAPMTWKQRWEYIWEYYKLALIAAAVLIVFTVSMVRSSLYQQKKLLISGIFINTTTTEEGYAFVKEDYWAHCGADSETRSELIEVRNIAYNAEQPTAMDANAVMTVDAMIAVGDLDYIICDRTAAEFYGRQEYCHDLAQKLPAGNWNLLQTETGFTAIDLTGSRLEREYGLYAQPSYILFPVTAPDWSRCERFLNYLFA